jgi:superfamily II RNA helicase
LEKQYYRRSSRRGAKTGYRKGKVLVRTESPGRTVYGKPTVDPELKPVFRRIGVPESRPFKPDPFQLKALDLIEDFDVLVSAPTGAGKTWIASQAIQSCLARNLTVWYASPLKALSNSIYQEFCHEFGPSYCGILTGDRKENTDARVVVGTTEILRNQLYDAMHEGTDIRSDLVILDEAHYLSDRERGVVWEEVLIYLPPRVRLLLLSATIPNAEEICAWLGKIRGTPNRVVCAEKRPVPLEMLFLFPDGLICPLGGRRGLSSKVRKLYGTRSERRRRRPEKPDFGQVIRFLREVNLLPAIFFLKSRADCDQALLSCLPLERSPQAESRLRGEVRSFLKDYPHLEGHRQMMSLLVSKVASHHGGQLPYWKVLVEKTMKKGYLEAIFSTSTVAAGVNFPARTVVLMQSDRYNGHEFIDLTSTELHQMIGRAGRRGKDHIGFAVVMPGLYQDPQLIYDLKDSPAEPIESQIHINFSMTLNLLLSHTPMEVEVLLERSFAAFQEERSISSPKGRWEQVLYGLRKALPEGRCDTGDPFQVLQNVQKRSGLEGAGESRGLLPCDECKHRKTCHGKKKGNLHRVIRDLRSLLPHIEELKGGLWLSFQHHVRFLKETGFVDETDSLTPEGYWASKLRLDQPLLIAEAIRKGAFHGVSSEALAGGLASFVWDRTQEIEMRVKGAFDLSEAEAMFNRVLEDIQRIRALKTDWGFENTPIVFWPCAALFMWSRGILWEKLLNFLSVDEGDMASLVMRTADHLRQITNLKETHPELAAAAQEAIALILREPVYIE